MVVEDLGGRQGLAILVDIEHLNQEHELEDEEPDDDATPPS